LAENNRIEKWSIFFYHTACMRERTMYSLIIAKYERAEPYVLVRSSWSSPRKERLEEGE
jgi:hypothetical protein